MLTLRVDFQSTVTEKLTREHTGGSLSVMTKEPLYYAYSDDSPILTGPENHLAVAVVVTLKAGDKKLARIPKRVRQRIMGKELRQLPELKFYNSDEKTRMRMLQMLAGEQVEIFALVVDKEGRKVSDSPLNNGLV